MNMKKMCFVLGALGLAALLSAASCSSETFVKSWDIRANPDSFNVIAKFTPDYEISMEGQFMFKDWGRAWIYQDNDGLFTIDLQFLRGVVGDIDLRPAVALPTGARFPSIINKDMFSVTLAQEPLKYRVIAYFDGFTAEPSLVGLAIQVEQVNNSFPQLAVTQNYFNDANEKIAAFTIYGPQLDPNNNVLVPGGIFVAANYSLGDIIGGSRSHGGFDITGKDADQYRTPQAREELIKKMLQLAEDTGIIRRR